MKKIVLFSCGLIWMIFCLSACAEEAPTAPKAPAPTRTFTPAPSATPTRNPNLPTVTGTPTPAPLETMTPTTASGFNDTQATAIAPAPISANFNEPKALLFDDFSTLNASGEGSQVAFVNPGEKFVLKNSAPWRAYSDLVDVTVKPGEGAILTYYYPPEADYMTFAIETGSYGTPDYKRWKLRTGSKTRVDVDSGDKSETLSYGNMILSPNTTYCVLLAYDQNSVFTAMLWERDKPERLIKLQHPRPADWAQGKWRVNVSISKGQMTLESFAKFTFSSYK